MCHDAAVDRDRVRLASERPRYDLLIVGGGIHGLFTAYDAATRGLSVLLLDRSDFGSGLSFNHQRTIHGGLRALQTGRWSKAREQVFERRVWATIAPRLVTPLPFVIGTYPFLKRSRVVVGAGLKIYNALSFDRNDGLPEALHLPDCRLVSQDAVGQMTVHLPRTNLTGGALWFDYQARHPDRLNWAVAQAARAAGAELGNYFEVVGPAEGSPDGGVLVRDVLGGGESVVHCRAIVIAAGSAVDATLGRFGHTQPRPMLRAMNILVARPSAQCASAAPGRSGRMLTAVPWRGLTLVGTHQSATVVPADRPLAGAHELDEMLTEVNSAFPSLAVTRADVRLLHQGLTPAIVRDGRVDLQPESEVLPLADTRQPLFAIVGVKFTTARQTAERAVNLVQESLQSRYVASATATTPLPHAGLTDEGERARFVQSCRDRMDADVMEHLLDWYGTEAPSVLSLALSMGLGHRLIPDSPVLAGEVAYAVRSAQAVRLSDVVLRRTLLGSAGHPGSPALELAADIMQTLLGWSAEQRAREVALVERFYRLPGDPATEP